MMHWTPDHIDRLSDLWSRGATTSMIATEFGTTRSAVLGKVHRLNLSKRHKVEVTRVPRQPVDRPPKPKRAPRLVSAPWTGFERVEPHAVGRPMIGAPRAWCRWPIDGETPRLCCSAPAIDGHSWCTQHARIAYARPRGHLLRPDGGREINLQGGW